MVDVTQSKPEASASNAGFTLLETLISISMLAMIGLIFANSFHFSLAVWSNSNETTSGSDTLRIKPLLSNIIGNIILVNTSNNNNVASTLAFDGTPSHIKFIAMHPIQVLPAGSYLVSLQLAQTLEQNIHLTLAYTQLHHGAPLIWSHPISLSQAKSAQFSYFGPKNDSRQAGWHTSWQNQWIPPKLVKLTFTPLHSDSNFNTELIFRSGNNSPPFIKKISPTHTDSFLNFQNSLHHKRV